MPSKKKQKRDTSKGTSPRSHKKQSSTRSLPEGWSIEVRERKSGDQSGQLYEEYKDPAVCTECFRVYACLAVRADAVLCRRARLFGPS